MKLNFYRSYWLLRLGILLAMVFLPQVSHAQGPNVETLDNGSVLIQYPNGTLYTNVDHAGDPVGSSLRTDKGEWVDCRKNEAKCREELEEAEDGDSGGDSDGKKPGKKKKKRKKKKRSMANQHSPSISSIEKLSVGALRKLPGKKSVSRISKEEFLKKYGSKMRKARRR